MKQHMIGLLGVMLFMHAVKVQAQQQPTMQASSVISSDYVRDIPPLSQMDNIISSVGFEHVAPPKRRGSNIVVPGKGLPQGPDPLVSIQRNLVEINAISAPIANFVAHQGTVLNDPTGAIGPNHYVYAFNSGFGIKDRSGNVLLPEASLGTLFPGETLGDPVVIYDNYADRFIIMQFSNTPNGILIAVCQGPDPVNDGWFTYRFNTGAFPDYEKLSIWTDGYYITANKSSGTAGTSEVVYALERDQMLVGGSAQMIGFPLPGIVTSGFYSPGGINSTGPSLPPLGTGHQIIYMQDDAWAGVSTDHLKIWTTSVNWANPSSSSISLTQSSLNTAAFDGVFDGGSFQNIDEPGNGPDIDALQATMMYMTNYRRFGTHNSVVLNFVVDISGNDTRAGIRWMELRQTTDGAPWTVYQEGTYVDPNGHSAFSGSVIMDGQGNIGMGYTIASTTQFTSIRYTGRLSSDPLGTMPQGEGFAVDGDAQNNRFDGRYGDYAQITIDPLDDQTFWHIGEYMQGSASTVRKSRVVAFQLAPAIPDNESPTTPTNLTVSGVTSLSVSLTWTASTDNVGIAGYDVFSGGTIVTSVGSTTSATVTGLTPNTSYTFTVRARDAAGNVSSQSASVSATTPDVSGCAGGISSFPYTEGFEGSIGAWTQATGDDLNWTVDANGTPSNNTGPSSAFEGSDYIYVEASVNGTGYPDKQAILVSPCFDLSGLTSPSFNFNYHMFGSNDMGSIDLEISIDNGISWSSLWNQTGNQGNAWQSVSIDLSAFASSGVLLRFNRITGGTWQADIALDNLSLTDGDAGNDCAASDLTLTITLDNYPQETSWSISGASGVVASNSYSTANPDGSTVIESINGLAGGDYTFTINDSFGDGICCSYGLGSYTLSSANGVIAEGGEFNFSESISFCVNGFAQARETSNTPATLNTHTLSDESEASFSIYPNPVKNILHIEGAEAIEDVMIFSMYGQLVDEVVDTNKGFNKLDVSALSSGIYFIRIQSEGLTLTRKFVIE